MSWNFPDQYVATGDTVDPRDLAVNVNRYAGEINGHMDRDNVPAGILVRTKWPTGTFIVPGSNPSGGSTLQQLGPNETGTWITLTGSQNNVQTDDGAIKVTGQANYFWAGLAAACNNKLEFRLLVNGLVVASSGWYLQARFRATCRLVGIAPTTTGTTTIEMQWRAYASPITKIDDIANGVFVGANQLVNPPYTSDIAALYAVNVLWERRRR